LLVSESKIEIPQREERQLFKSKYSGSSLLALLPKCGKNTKG
jgi:hypothetical protein